MKLVFNSILLLVFCWSACLAGNIVAESIITASSLPNPAWAPENVSDGDTGPTKGWLGEWDKKNPDLWIQFTFNNTNKVSAMRVMQAGLPEAGRSRFSRPRKIRVLFFNDGGSTEKTLELKDREHIFQDLEIEPVDAKVIRIEVLDVYPGSRIEEMAGFQEIEIEAEGTDSGLPGRAPGGSEVNKMSDREIADAVREALSKKSANEVDESDKVKEKSAGEDAAGKEEAAEKPGITGEEREILELLGELMNRLEKHFEGD
ncbi:MAG: hypothetical protein ABIH66_08025 [bacterium]